MNPGLFRDRLGFFTVPKRSSLLDPDPFAINLLVLDRKINLPVDFLVYERFAGREGVLAEALGAFAYPKRRGGVPVGSAVLVDLEYLLRFFDCSFGFAHLPTVVSFPDDRKHHRQGNTPRSQDGRDISSLFRLVPCTFRHTHKNMSSPARSSKGCSGCSVSRYPSASFHPFTLSLP